MSTCPVAVSGPSSCVVASNEEGAPPLPRRTTTAAGVPRAGEDDRVSCPLRSLSLLVSLVSSAPVFLDFVFAPVRALTLATARLRASSFRVIYTGLDTLRGALRDDADADIVVVVVAVAVDCFAVFNVPAVCFEKSTVQRLLAAGDEAGNDRALLAEGARLGEE